MQETQEMWVRSLGWEDPLEQEMARHSSILAGKIPWAEEPDGLWGHRDAFQADSLPTEQPGKPCRD